MSEIINPQDAELEEIILGSCLIESKAITLIADILRPEAFIMKKSGDLRYVTKYVSQRTENRYHNSQRRTCPTRQT